MIRHRFILLASLVPLAATSPAAAQLAPGISGFSSAPTSASEGEYWEFIRRLGLCLADAKEADARAFLAETPGSAGETAVFARLFHRQTNSCMGNFVSASFPRAYVRGAVAEGFVKMMSETERAAIISRTVSDVSDVRTMHDFARCYVAQQPATALAFLAETRLASKGETEAVRQMAGGFGPCLPQGREVTIKPTDIRMAIAEALYHAAYSPAASTEIP